MEQVRRDGAVCVCVCGGRHGGAGAMVKEAEEPLPEDLFWRNVRLETASIPTYRTFPQGGRGAGGVPREGDPDPGQRRQGDGQDRLRQVQGMPSPLFHQFIFKL